MPLFALLLTSSLALAQESQETTLQTLLKEVHALRIAMEHSNQIAPKVQIALARMQVQEERVRNANRQLQDARNRIRRALRIKAGRKWTITWLNRRKPQQAQTVDPTTRKQMDLDIQASKAELAQLSKLEQQSQAQEAEANSQLLNEQAKWNEVNDLLTSIERMLAPVQP